MDGSPHHARMMMLCVPFFFSGCTSIHRKIVTVITVTYHLIKNALFMSKIQFDVSVSNVVAIEKLFPVLNIMCKFHVSALIISKKKNYLFLILLWTLSYFIEVCVYILNQKFNQFNSKDTTPVSQSNKCFIFPELSRSLVRGSRWIQHTSEHMYAEERHSTKYMRSVTVVSTKPSANGDRFIGCLPLCLTICYTFVKAKSDHFVCCSTFGLLCMLSVCQSICHTLICRNHFVCCSTYGSLCMLSIPLSTCHSLIL